MARLLVVDDDQSILTVLTTLLRQQGYEVTAVSDAEQAQEQLRAGDFELLISDLRMGPLNGVDLLRWVRAERPETAVMILTAFGSVQTALTSMKMGAFDYITKPFKVDALLRSVERALRYQQAMAENLALRRQFRTRYRLGNIVAESPSMRRICEMIERLAASDATVLICGESGTGKEVVAKAIHAHSARKNQTFLAVNCAALPEPLLESEMFGHVKGAFTGAVANKKGLFEAVEDGTLFLDEIGSVSMAIQAKLLRVLQEKELRRVGGNDSVPVRARILAATNVRLEDLISQGRFREDLYYRLSTIPITIEPLRTRREDIMPVVYHFMRKECGPTRELPLITEEAREKLEAYAWPGNIRELENCMRHAMVFARDNRITLDVLPPRMLGRSLATASADGNAATSRFLPMREYLERQERRYIEQVLTLTAGNRADAAQLLQVSLATFYRRKSDRRHPAAAGALHPAAEKPAQ